MEPVKVSVIIPVYNTGKYIRDTLRCIMDQSLQEIEIIIIDDGSTDDSFQIIREIADQDGRLKIHKQENKGQSESRNFGIGVANGKYIYFMDSDDLLDKNTLADCYEASEKDGLDFLFFDADVFGDSKNVSNINLNYKRTQSIQQQVYTGPDILGTLLKYGGYHASPCLSFIRLSYLKRISLFFFPGIIHEDELFTFILYIYSDRVGFIKQAFFKRRLRDNSIMSVRFSRKNLIGYFKVADELKKFKGQLTEKRLKLLVDLRLYHILDGVLYNSRILQKRDKWYALFHSVFHYHHYISMKNILVLIFPFLRRLKKK